MNDPRADVWSEMLTTSFQYIFKPRPPRRKNGTDKEWWTDELEARLRIVRRAQRESHRWRGLPEDPVHAYSKTLRREYQRAIYIAKLIHQTNEERRMLYEELPGPQSIL